MANKQNPIPKEGTMTKRRAANGEVSSPAPSAHQPVNT
jgi:hypothetical protein